MEMPSAAFITGDYALNAPKPEPNGCAYYRLVLPSRELQKLGWDTASGLPRVHNERGIGLAHDDGAFFGFDISVFKLLMHESVPTMFRMMQHRGEKIVVDVDDFHFGIDPGNIAARQTDPNRNAENNRMFYEMGIRQADLVTVSTEFLANFYEARCRKVRLVRNALDVERYTMVEQPEKPVFGWVGGTLWRSRDIELLADWMPKFVDSTKVSVHHSGHIPGDTRHFAARAGLRRVSTTPMQLVSKYPSLLTHFHVGLVPLQLNDFNRSKSYLKGLEYAAAGIPFIATPTEEYRLLHQRGVGRLASTPDEWRDHAIELLDRDVRVTEAQRQRKIVEREFNIETRGPEWDSALRS
jgi:glycosyltransferase involved in cell wall biosynthesis